MKRRTLSFVVLLLVSQGLLGMDCVDGVTPDCSDAAAKCGPSLDDASPDTSTPLEAGPDAAPDAPADAVDEGAGDAGDADV